MVLTTDDQGQITRRLYVLGLPKPMIHPLVEMVSKWVACSGLEWTIGRCKSIKVDIVRMKAGLEPASRIRKNKRGRFFGPLGSLIRWSLKNDRNFRKGVQVMNLYTYWKLSEVSKSQWDKFYNGIVATPSDLSTLPADLAYSTRTWLRKHANHSRVGLPSSFVTYRGSPAKRAPGVTGKSMPQDSNPLSDLDLFADSSFISLLSKYRRIFYPLLEGVEIAVPSNKYRFSPCLTAGNIAFIQEPGAKLRTIASPFRIYQEALRPLSNYLYSFVRSLPWDCTHDQSKAMGPIQDALNNGVVVHSIDLSSATDYFPLGLQSAAVRSVVPSLEHDYVDLWEDISRAEWRLPNGERISWTKGQPLGVLPSFAAFTMSHGFLLLMLNQGRHDGQFFVLGDDVVILDEALHSAYRQALAFLECPVSESKSLSSSMMAEFAGKLISPRWVIPQLKWREMSDDNFLELCRLLGPRSRTLLLPRQRAIFDKVKNLLEPVGLNFSYPGSNYLQMWEATVNSRWFRPEEVVLASLLGLRQRMNQNLHSGPSFSLLFNSNQLEKIAETFDEKVRQVFQQTVFSRWETTREILNGLDDMPAALELLPRLPPKSLPLTRMTLLDRYENA